MANKKPPTAPQVEEPITGYLLGEVVVDHGRMGKVLVTYKVPIVSFIGPDGIRDFKFSGPVNR